MAEVLLAQANSLYIPLRDKSVHCCVTSPPYFGLRQYNTGEWIGGDADCTHSPADTPQRRGLAKSTLGGGKQTTGHQREGYRRECHRCGAMRMDQQLGSETRHDCLGWATGENCGECYLCHMRAVWRELWRVLRDDGTCFLNIADTYASSWPCSRRNVVGNGSLADGKRANRPPRLGGALKEKDMCLIPQRLALALQSDGWYIRSDIIWNKPNTMPENVTDRVTRSHEYVWLLSKLPYYLYDADAVRQPYSASGLNDAVHGYGWGKKVNGKMQQLLANGTHGKGGLNDPLRTRDAFYQHGGANLRTVWTINTEPSPYAHFAMMPTELVRRCIQAGTSQHGVCSACGAPWRRQRCVVSSWRDSAYTQPQAYAEHSGNRTARTHSGGMSQNVYQDMGWQPSCACDAPTTSAVVFDPFCGSGTTLAAAHELGRSAVGLDLSWQYLSGIARPRLNDVTRQGQLFPIRLFPVTAPAPLPQQEVLL